MQAGDGGTIVWPGMHFMPTALSTGMLCPAMAFSYDNL